MEIQLQELIDKIKTDGAEVAQSDAEKIKAEAQAEADRIIREAKEEANRIIASAKSENERVVKSGEDALRQASRNTLIAFRESITMELGALLSAEVEKNYSKGELDVIIPKVVTEWAKNVQADDITVLLNEEDLKSVETSVISALQKKIAGGVTLKADDSFEGGFRVAEKNGSAYYDFSAETVAEMFSAYLNPKVTAILKEATDL